MRCPPLARRPRVSDALTTQSPRKPLGGTRRAVSLAAAVMLALATGCWHRAPTATATTTIGPALAPAAAPEASQEYRIQSGDELHVRFTYQPDVSEEVPVRPDGRITLATTGELVVAGMTPSELERLVAEKSASRLRNPHVPGVVTNVARQPVHGDG